MRVYLPTMWPIASCQLFFDIQVLTLLLGEYTLFARTNLYYLTTRLRSYFSIIFVAHFVRWDVREASAVLNLKGYDMCTTTLS